MANTPRMVKDPTEAALSAIQDALNLRETAPGHPSSAPPGSADAIDTWPRRQRPAADQDLFYEETPQTAEQAAPRRAAANDDRRSVGQLLQALQQRPSRTPYVVAVLLSLAWAAVALALAWQYLGGSWRSAFALGLAGTPQLLAISAAILVPIVFFFVLAHMVSRAQELRMISRSMTEVAMRLAEPESIASESIVSVGQAIRREVAAMGDGVERALARAGELESLVHNEVAALERAYNDNELRIRGLIEDLASQREFPDRPGRSDPQFHHQRAYGSHPGRHLGQRAGVVERQRRGATHHPLARREGRAHHGRARTRRRFHDRCDRRSRRRAA